MLNPLVPRRRKPSLCTAVVLLAAGACVEVDGGGVEMSWVLRTPQGHAISGCGCTDPAVRWVRFDLQGMSPEVAGSAPCRDREACRFSCDRSNGATPLDIPPGRYSIALVPLDEAGGVLERVTTPPPVVRDVTYGQTTDLGALQVTAGCAPACFSNIDADCRD